MVKDIVVNLTGAAPQEFAADYAISLAKLFEAHIAGVGFIYEPVIPGTVMGGIPTDLIEAQREENTKAAKAAASRFEAAAAARRAFGRGAHPRRQRGGSGRSVRAHRAAVRSRGGGAGPAQGGRFRGAVDRGGAVRIRAAGGGRAVCADQSRLARAGAGVLGRQPSGHPRHRGCAAVPAARQGHRYRGGQRRARQRRRAGGHQHGPAPGAPRPHGRAQARVVRRMWTCRPRFGRKSPRPARISW